MGADRVKEVGVPLEAIGVLTESIRDLHFLIEVVRLLIGTVVTLSSLEAFKHPPVIINNFGQVLDSVCPVERVVGVEAGRVALLILVRGVVGQGLGVEFGRLQVNLEHLFQ